jgi:hypothetical protein
MDEEANLRRLLNTPHQPKKKAAKRKKKRPQKKRK